MTGTRQDASFALRHKAVPFKSPILHHHDNVKSLCVRRVTSVVSFLSHVLVVIINENNFNFFVVLTFKNLYVVQTILLSYVDKKRTKLNVTFDILYLLYLVLMG